MMQKFNIVFHLLFCFVFIEGKAQTSGSQCVDTLQVSKDPCHGTIYYPVCGCDGNTYRNECAARAEGVLQWNQGPCELFDYDFVPNPMVDQGFIRIFTREQTDVQIWIFDTYYGQRYYYRFPSVYPLVQLETTIDVRGFGNGLYFMVMEAGGTFKVKRLLVNQLD
ncbi:MAG: T9SS type A sorting domain-containing protein [Bacteroidia bacterium]|nr:T9SS type A sorting domain-containing protein [Bacteroidia bacterium]